MFSDDNLLPAQDLIASCGLSTSFSHRFVMVHNKKKSSFLFLFLLAKPLYFILIYHIPSIFEII